MPDVSAEPDAGGAPRSSLLKVSTHESHASFPTARAECIDRTDPDFGLEQPHPELRDDQRDRPMRRGQLLQKPHRVRRPRCARDSNDDWRRAAHRNMRSVKTKPRKTMLITPFIVKNAALRREKSSDLDQRVLVKKKRRGDDHTREVENPRARAHSGDRKRDHSREVHCARDSQRVRLAERRRHGIKSVLPIKRDVLQSVEDVESRQPTSRPQSPVRSASTTGCSNAPLSRDIRPPERSRDRCPGRRATTA